MLTASCGGLKEIVRDHATPSVNRHGPNSPTRAFPPGHLKEHAVSADPVRVFYRADGPDLVVSRIEDAG